MKSQFWLVLDVLEGRCNHSVEVFWHLAPELHWQLQANSALATWQSGGLALLFADSWSPRIQDGWYTPVYGSRTRNQQLVFHHEGELPETFATLLVPLANSNCNVGRFTRIHQNSADNCSLVYRYDCLPESHFFFFSARKPWRWRELDSDAEFLYYSISESGDKKLIVCGATYVKVAGQRVISGPRVLSRLEWSSETAHDFFSCSDEDVICSTSWEHLTSLEGWAAEVAQ